MCYNGLMKKPTWENAAAHFKTVMQHKMLVARFCFESGLYAQGILHDLSKLSPTEFTVGARYYQGTRSPNNAEREDIGVSTSWLHHKGRNRHHFEYWVDYPVKPEPGHILTGTRMPRRYVAEMIFDRVSASMTYLGDAYHDGKPLEYFLKSKKELGEIIHPVTLRQMEFLLRMWAERGEKYTTAYIRDHFLKRRSGSVS